jgi:hypothetical protein
MLSRANPVAIQVLERPQSGTGGRRVGGCVGVREEEPRALSDVDMMAVPVPVVRRYRGRCEQGIRMLRILQCPGATAEWSRACISVQHLHPACSLGSSALSSISLKGQVRI